MASSLRQHRLEAAALQHDGMEARVGCLSAAPAAVRLTMRLLAVVLLAVLQPGAAISVTSCKWRPMEQVLINTDAMSLTEFVCKTDEDLYLTSVIDSDITLLATSTQAQVAAALSASSHSQDFDPGHNFAGDVRQDWGDGNVQIVHNAMHSLAGNVGLKCGSKQIVGEPAHAPPLTHLYMTTPTINPLSTLWQGFGAYKFAEPKVAKTFTFFISNSPGGGGPDAQYSEPAFTVADLEDCTTNNDLEVVILDDNYGEDYACTPEDGCSTGPRVAGPCDETSHPGSCFPWKFTDGAGNRLSTTSIKATKDDTPCNISKFSSFAAERLPTLFQLLESASTQAEQQAALMTCALDAAMDPFPRSPSCSVGTRRLASLSPCTPPCPTCCPTCGLYCAVACSLQPAAHRAQRSATRASRPTRSLPHSYTTTVNSEEWANCQVPFDAMYKTTSTQVTLPNAKVCVDPEDKTDPCCDRYAEQRRLRWTDCCIASDRDVTITGVFDGVDADAVSAQCGANAALVTNFIEQSMKDVLMAATHPELGCDARNAKLTDDSGIWERHVDALRPCYNQVIWGQSKQGLEYCNTNDQCWSQSCVSDGYMSHCARITGGAAALPILDCVLEKIDPDVLQALARKLGFDPVRVKAGATPLTKAEKDEYANKLKMAIAEPTCTGPNEQATQGWCTIELTQEECGGVQAWDQNNRLIWIADTGSTTQGYCKRQDNHLSVPGFEVNAMHPSHPYTQEEACAAIYEALGGYCALPVGKQPAAHQYPPPTDYVANQAKCEADGGAWTSYSGKTTKWYSLRSSHTYAYDPETERWGEAFVQGDEEKCEMQMACNWDPRGTATGGDESKCLDPSLIDPSKYHGQMKDAVDADGDKATCLRCWGSHCEEFHDAYPAVCAAAPWSDANTASSQTGGGPDGLASLTQRTDLGHGHGSWLKFRRDHLATATECLDQRICPVPSKDEHQSPWDMWIWNCGDPGCFALGATEGECHTSPLHGEWRTEWKGGAGLCKLHYKYAEQSNPHPSPDRHPSLLHPQPDG